MGTPTTATASLISKQNALKLAPLRSSSRSGEAYERIRFAYLPVSGGVHHPFCANDGEVARHKASPRGRGTAAERS